QNSRKTCGEIAKLYPAVIARSISDDPPSLAMRAMAGLESAEAPLRVGGSNPFFLSVARWIASLRSQ
ncbi:MAG: hypothetical protein WBF73_36050, partial [Bradyrhizobium sp.]